MKTSTEILYRSDFASDFFDYLVGTLHDGEDVPKHIGDIMELHVKMEFVQMFDRDDNRYD